MNEIACIVVCRLWEIVDSPAPDSEAIRLGYCAEADRWEELGRLNLAAFRRRQAARWVAEAAHV